MSKHPKTRNRDRIRHAGAGTKRRDAPALERGKPRPSDIPRDGRTKPDATDDVTAV